MSTDAPIDYLVRFSDRAKIRVFIVSTTAETFSLKVTSTDIDRLVRLAGFSYTTLSLCSSMLGSGFFILSWRQI